MDLLIAKSLSHFRWDFYVVRLCSQWALNTVGLTSLCTRTLVNGLSLLKAFEGALVTSLCVVVVIFIKGDLPNRKY